MHEYVSKALSKSHHVPAKRTQHAPHPWNAPVYCQKIQYATHSLSSPLNKKGNQRVQVIASTFLYYSYAVDPTIIASLNEVSRKQSSPITLTESACNQLLDYLHSYPYAVLRYYASDMILSLVPNAAYLVLPNAHVHCATLDTLSNKPTSLPLKPAPNGPFHVTVKTIKGVPASASKAETGGIFLGAQESCPILTTLLELGHPQPSTSTPLETDNSTATDILTAQVRMKRYKAFDMQYY